MLRSVIKNSKCWHSKLIIRLFSSRGSILPWTSLMLLRCIALRIIAVLRRGSNLWQVVIAHPENLEVELLCVFFALRYFVFYFGENY